VNLFITACHLAQRDVAPQIAGAALSPDKSYVPTPAMADCRKLLLGR